MSVIATIEDDIVQRLRTKFAAHVRKIDTLPGPWTFDLLSKTLQKAPAIYVAFTGGPAHDFSETVFDAGIEVYAISKHYGREKNARVGNGRSIGAYEMIERIAPCLHNHTIEDVGTMSLKGIENVFGEAMFDLGGMVYAAKFLLPNVTLPYDVNLHAMADFTIWHAEHSLAPGGDEPAAVDELHAPE